VRRGSIIVLLALIAAGCGGHDATSGRTTTAAAPPPLPSFAKARARMFAARTVRIDQTTAIVVGGNEIKAYDRGTVALDGSRAHLYKLSAGTATAGEVIVVGPIVYSNENVQAALSTPGVKPWTRLDRRKLTARERAQRPNELAHVLAPAYLAYGARGVTPARRVADGALFWARIEPTLVRRSLSQAQRALLGGALASDYPAKPFNAKFWVDGRDRIRRVIVTWTTNDGTPVAIDTSFAGFGARVDTTPPPARSVEDVTARP
jgi:hypothetical protein